MPEPDARTLVLATRNPGKLRELGEMLQALDYRIVPVSDVSAASVEETATTFVENALLKARAASRASGLPAIADDSGLEVDALDGAPGVLSARFAGQGASDADNVKHLLDALRGQPRDARGARFRCVMVMLRHPEDPAPIICEGVWDGLITTEARGDRGFGYDPVFEDPTTGRTAAELAPQEKNARSHRARAIEALLARIVHRCP